jgi:hypothetical protein
MLCFVNFVNFEFFEMLVLVLADTRNGLRTRLGSMFLCARTPGSLMDQPSRQRLVVLEISTGTTASE